jgi:acyl-CoA thioester hydrolase
MSRRHSYFPEVPDAPPPLRATVERVVRFEEVDPLRIVWHGRFVSYMEDARVALGERYGIGYMDFYDRGVATPLKQVHCDFVKPLRFRERFTVEGILHWTEAARLNYEFVIRNAAGETAATGYSVQMMLDRDFQVLLSPPEFFVDFCARWRRGEVG